MAYRRLFPPFLTLALGLMLSLAAILLPARDGRAGEVVLFAAASTKDALEAIERLAVSRGIPPFVISFASSGALAKQIENGAPADLFLSADSRWMDYLAQRGLLAPGSRTELLGNRLVLVAPRNSDWSLDLARGAPLAKALGDGRLAMGDPAYVPAGRYGRMALEALGLWPTIELRIARTSDVRAALALVERGEAAAGIVYATDASASSGVRVVDEFPPGAQPSILYPLARVAGHDRPDVQAVYAFLIGAEARDVFAGFGFITATAGERESLAPE